ncbi:hypothetical protein ACFP2T_15225 [Plantactinospora solaniradicis]|uniref:Mycothiol-dependent maleylpyruvate isomerase metal-binding domain-containing protein n=1 Tax=Plantactinospora solaniradicis TaxID=1723736 RepID=A0ABW1K9S8_9ACTN
MYEEKLRVKPGSRWPNNQIRSIVAHLARLDAVDWLASSAQDGTPDRARPGPGQPSGGEGEVEDRIRPAEQVSLIAEAMTTGTWPKITGELDQVTSHPTVVRGELAKHGWCDLLVGMVWTIEQVKGPLNKLAEMPASLIKRAILTSSMQGGRPHVSGPVVDLVVGEVWRAFKATASGGIPLLDLVTNEEALRALRILAVFICPAPSKHPEVRKYALKPLGEDVHHVLNEQTEARLAELFVEWLP